MDKGEIAIDNLIGDASAATDRGDYEVALHGFEQALGAIQRTFGDNIKLMELEREISEIRDLLDEKHEKTSDF